MTSLAYRRSGAGEPLVLLHALGSSRQAWDLAAPALARHFDVIAVDLPGFSESAPLPGEPSPAALATAVTGRPRQARHIDQLPPGTHTGDLPGCGHLPMADDPAAVTALIIRSAARSADAAGPASTPQRAA